MIKTFNTKIVNADIAILIMRIWLGAMMIFHGSKKIFGNMERFSDSVEKLGFPFPDFFAYAAALSEFAGGILIIFGLFFRPVLLFVIITMLVAAFGSHGGQAFNRKELPLTFAVFSFSTLLTGPGKYSLDTLWTKIYKR